MIPAPHLQQESQRIAVDALTRRADALAATDGLSAQTRAFWIGYAKGLRDLHAGVGSALAEKDARSGHQVLDSQPVAGRPASVASLPRWAIALLALLLFAVLPAVAHLLDGSSDAIAQAVADDKADAIAQARRVARLGDEP